MFLCRYLGTQLRPKLGYFSHQIRSVRPTIKIGKDKFQISIDVKEYAKEELSVKAREEYVIIEGRQERKTATGCLVRRFVKKYKLPSGCNPGAIKTTLSTDGTLTVTAPRSYCDLNTPCETFVPITSKEESEAPIQHEGLSGKKV